ncbi:MAG: SpoIIE family protein phosphatase [bacterium]
MFKRVEKEQLKVPAHIDYLGDLRDFVTQVGKKYRFSDKLINAFKLAIDEAATNIIRHAYRENNGFITVRSIVKENSLTISLIDQGTYFDPKRVKEPDLRRYIDIGKKGGLGIFIMRKVMDEIDYRRTEEGNELRITKYRETPQKKKLFTTVSSIPLSIKAKYFFRTIAIITLMITVGYFYFYIKTDDYVISELIISGRATCSQIINRISSAPTEELVFIEDIVHPLYEENKDKIYRLSVEDSTGIIVYSSNLSEMLRQFIRPSRVELIEPGVYRYYLVQGVKVFEFEYPIKIKDTNKYYGKTHVFLSTESADKAISAIRLNDLKLALFILGLSTTGVAVLIYLVMIPFSKLADWVKELGHGEIDDEIDIDASTEIGEIAQAFSDITQKFRESQKNLADQERLQKEMQVAQEIQQTLLPMEFPELEGYEIASYYEAAKEVGGDYYDFVEVDKDSLGIAVADVSGKGVPGSLVMTMIRTALRTEARGVKDAAEVLSRVNTFVSGDIKKGMFVTIFYLIIDSKKRRLNYASAGHNPMILYRGSTKKTYYLNPKGFPIGIQLPQRDIFRNYIESDTIQLAEDDILLVYTDGITEAMNSRRELLGEERLLKILREFGHLPVNSFVDKLKEGIYSFTEGSPQFDDITLVAIKEKSSREKDELRRAKEAHKLIGEEMSIREACETVGITTYAYYNKYKRIFEEEGIESFEIDPDVSVEAKHLSIEEKTRIFDIIASHPEYGASRISTELNTEKYGFTQISESKIYEELVRNRLNTRQLREAFVEKGKRGRRRLKPPGTPLLTLDGKLIIDRQLDIAENEEKFTPQNIRPNEKEETTEDQEVKTDQRIETSHKTFEPSITEEKIDETSVTNITESEIEAEALIDSSIEEILSKDYIEETETQDKAPEMSTEIIKEENQKEVREMEDSQDLIEEFVPETNLSEAISDLDEEQNILSQFEEEIPETSQNDEISFEELFENVDFSNDTHEDKLNSSDIEELVDEDLSTSSVEELLAHDSIEDFSANTDITSEEIISSNVDNDADEFEEDSVSFSDLLKTLDDEMVYFSKQYENNQSQSKDLQTVKHDSETEEPTQEFDKSSTHLNKKEMLLISGIKYYKNKDYENAIKEFKKVIDIYPDFKEAYSILGNAYFRNQMYTEAATAYERVKQMDPNDITAYENMGVIHANRGEYTQAIEEWKKVLELNPERTDIKKKIKKALQKM